MSTLLHKTSTGILVSLMAFSAILHAAMPIPTHATNVNSIIKGSASTLYWYASNGKRYVFPNFGTFASWYGNNANAIQYVSDNELSHIMLGGNVTYKPGVRLVKITTDPKVYAVSRYGVLRWITSESVATDLYGNGWRWMVDDVPDEFFTNYTVGAPIFSRNDFSPTSESASILSLNENIPGIVVAPYSVPPLLTPSTVSTDRLRLAFHPTSDGISRDIMTVREGGFYSVGAHIEMAPTWVPKQPIIYPETIRIYDGNGVLLKTCDAALVNYCGFDVQRSEGDTAPRTYYATTSNGQRAIVSDRQTITIFPVSEPVFTIRTMPDSTKPNVCGQTFGVLATITTTGAANVSYQWEESNGTLSPVQNIIFTQAETKTISKSWTLSTAYTGWIRLKILSPVTLTSNQVSITSQCVSPLRITSPYNDQILTTYPRAINLSWTGGSSQRHKVEIRSNPNWPPTSFTDSPNILDISSPSSVRVLMPETDGAFQVRIQDIYDNGDVGPWSDPVIFRFDTRTTP